MQDALEIVDPLEHASWNDFLKSTPTSNFFHTSNWARVLCDSYNYRPAYFANMNSGGFDALLPVLDIKSRLTGRRGVSLPFSDYCSPISRSDEESVRSFEKVVTYGRAMGWKYYEMRSGRKLSHRTPPSATFARHELPLDSDEDKMMSLCDQNTRRCIRKADRAGVEVEMSASREAMDTYIRLNEVTRRRHGLPPQPRRFFDNIYRDIISLGMGLVSIARHRGHAVAGSVYFRLHDKVIYKYGAMLPEAGPVCAGFASAWEAIRRYASDGCTSMCLGRSDLQDKGLIRYKAAWGGKQFPLFYHCWDLRRNTFVKRQPKTHGVHTAIFRNMPQILSRKVGSLLYRHVG